MASWILIKTLLKQPTLFPHPAKDVKLIETHISWVLLAGRYAYKIKKPVDFGFLDFSDLAKREFFCREELRLNQRLAPHLYLGVIAIGGCAEAPAFGQQPAFEYAVRMRRFAADKTLDAQLAANTLEPTIIDDLANSIAAFHASLPAAERHFGDADAILAPALDNFRQLAELLPAAEQAELTALREQCRHQFQQCRDHLERRQQQGMIRECHGDLHLGNIVLLSGKPTAFDGIEFNPALRCIDTINDVAFLVMDLLHRQRADLGYRFLNAYLQIAGDYHGLSVLRFYLAYRAMVRGKVAALRASQQPHEDFAECRQYLVLTEQLLNPEPPALIITHGLPGCGKTTLSQMLLEKLPAIRLRSDVERKRLYQPTSAELYSAGATEHTYRHLLAQARLILQSGFSVIVDAAFLKRRERDEFRALANELRLSFAIISIRLDEASTISRLKQRQQLGRDASDADENVYRLLQSAAEPLADQELEFAVTWINDGVETEPGLYDELKRVLNL